MGMMMLVVKLVLVGTMGVGRKLVDSGDGSGDDSGWWW